MKKLVVLGLLTSLFLAGCSQTTQTKNLDEFAQCLTEKGAIMYGSKTCPHCLDQKQMFGKSFTYINYVECTETPERCANLQGVPTWEIGSGNYLVGKQEFAALAEATDCTLAE